MTDDLKYPSRYEIEQSLTEFCRRGFVEDFLRSRGVFITHATQSDLAEFVSGLLLEHGELEQIRNAALQVHSRSTLAGFLVTCEDETFSLVDLLDSWHGRVVDQKANMKFGAFTSTRQAGAELHQGQVEYTQRRPGRVQFLQARNDPSTIMSVRKRREFGVCWWIASDPMMFASWRTGSTASCHVVPTLLPSINHS